MSNGGILGPDGREVGQNTGGLIGPDGRPIGAQPDTAGEMNGLRWGVAFLILDGGYIGVHPLEPDDVKIIDVPMGDGLPPQMWVTMRGRPLPDGNHRFVEGWGEMPGMAAGMLAAHMNDDLGTTEEFEPPPEPPAPNVT